MILKTYSRIFTEDLDASLAVLKRLVDREPEMRVQLKDMEVATLGGFCFLAGPADSIKPFLNAVGPVIMDDIKATKAVLEEAGAAITQPITEGPTGWSGSRKSGNKSTLPLVVGRSVMNENPSARKLTSMSHSQSR